MISENTEMLRDMLPNHQKFYLKSDFGPEVEIPPFQGTLSEHAQTTA